MSLSQTIQGLHWDRIPNDNDDEVAARGILYLLIFQQLGQLVRWSWGYHVLLAPRDRFLEDEEREETGETRIEQGRERYTDNPDQTDPDEPLVRTRSSEDLNRSPGISADDVFHSGEQTPVSMCTYTYAKGSLIHSGDEEVREAYDPDEPPSVIGPPPSGPFLPRRSTQGEILQFPDVETTARESQMNDESRIQLWKAMFRRRRERVHKAWEKKTGAIYGRLPPKVQKTISTMTRVVGRFFRGLWDFMNPPLWAMLTAIIVASVPALQHLFFNEGTFVRNSVTRAVEQNAQVAVPLILVVLGANLARNTLSEEALADMEHPAVERKLIIASLLARMFLPTLIMAPILALMAKFLPISILDDPIFIIVCFLLTGAPSALQLAQICQINNVYVGAMSKLLFQSYVVWYVPPTFLYLSTETDLPQDPPLDSHPRRFCPGSLGMGFRLEAHPFPLTVSVSNWQSWSCRWCSLPYCFGLQRSLTWRFCGVSMSPGRWPCIPVIDYSLHPSYFVYVTFGIFRGLGYFESKS